MLKRFVVSLLTLAFLTLGAGTALGAPDPAKLEELKVLHKQMYDIRVQIIDKRVEAGLLDKEKAAQFKEVMERHQKKFEEDMAKGEYNFGKKHGKDCKKNLKGNSQSAPDAKSSPSTH